ncbi:Mfs1.1 [Trametes coccinea BRFM310]|uniref:Mfs1.1 n=1 Tax=Trametes coccinea (strain BRFM310) TaxID=1353009 RepID=A0A1Y2IER8_TRAC3|nr:Mfs1.1 [Trametes coccinea BRFM310]
MADSNQQSRVTEVAPSSSNSSSSEPQARKGIRFWIILGSLVLGTFLCVLESYATSTALPTIVRDLHSGEFVWVASAYALSTLMLQSQMFGRRQVILGSLAVFIVGSALSGAAQSMNMLIAGRAVHGAGAGGITTLSQIILSDLVTLRERGTYNGLFGLTWAIGGGIGPIIGGSLAHHTIWRWIFYLNVPAGAVIALLLLFFLRLRKPPAVKRTFREVLGRVDLLGNLLLIGASCACAIALTWGGVQFAWQSPSVLVPLCLGVAGFCVWALYEWRFCSYPVVPAHLLLNRTSFSGSVSRHYLPVYYQACKDASPAASGIDLFGLCFSTGPMAIITGISVGKSKVYRVQLWVGWCLILVGVGLMNIITEDSNRSLSIGFQVVTGIGIGILYSAAYFPVLAPLPITSTAFALSFYVFLRSFAQIWGVTIGGALLQNELQRRLPLTVQNAIPGLNNVAYAVIPLIPTMAQPEKDLTRKAFAESLAIIWRMLTAVAGVGLIASFFMKGLPLHTQRDENWAVAVESERDVDDAEKPDA